MLQAPSMDISGNSGCSVRLIKKGYQLAVEKSCSQASYIPRLKAQIEKQNTFRAFTSSVAISIPELYWESESINHYCAVMEFLPYLDFIDFFGTCSVPALFKSIDTIEAFIDENTRSSTSKINLAALAKLYEIEQKVTTDKDKIQIIQHSARQLRNILLNKDIFLPNGECHGDFTLSNMVFTTSGENIGLFDFLDSYIDSPAIDLVKLRQDTQLGWSFIKTRKPSSRIRIHQGLNQMDLFAERKLSELDVSKEDYNVLQAVNILRILPYANDALTLSFIQRSLNILEA
ncbi:phosphotransferase [Marinimicrobium sp. ARAG 43.8]|uniref:phosphotransferase n=1 Tax=Marinimicrobium sp. ARAG 43.8 TaxID=3418719 RepID=UPI003CEA9198